MVEHFRPLAIQNRPQGGDSAHFEKHWFNPLEFTQIFPVYGNIFNFTQIWMKLSQFAQISLRLLKFIQMFLILSKFVLSSYI